MSSEEEELRELMEASGVVGMPPFPNRDDEPMDQLLDIMNAQTWFLKWGEMVKEKTLPESIYEVEERMEVNRLLLERAKVLLGNLTKKGLESEMMWLQSQKFTPFQKEFFKPVWENHLDNWIKKI